MFTKKFILASRVAKEMPLPDVIWCVAGARECFSHGDAFGLEWHIVDENAVCKRILAGEQAPTMRTADRKSRYGVIKAAALVRESIENGAAHIRIAVVTSCLSAPLIH